jgi:paired amphipathic helix protein Sin3a
MENVCKRVQELFKGHRQLLTEFNKLIPPDYRINMQVNSPQPSVQYEDAIEYLKRVKDDTRNEPDIYKEFIRILKLYQSQQITQQSVYEQVQSLMKNYPELFEHFVNFLPNTQAPEEVEEDEAEVIKRKRRRVDTPLMQAVVPPIHFYDKYLIEELNEVPKHEQAFFEALKILLVMNSSKGADYFNEFCRCLDLYTDCIITHVELCEVVAPLFVVTDPTIFINPNLANIRSAQHQNTAELTTKVEAQLALYRDQFKVFTKLRESSRRKTGWFFRPLSEYDSKSMKRHGHSYLEIKRPKIPARGRTEELKEQLNSQWVSVPYGSEDYSFKLMRKNIYEDALFKCEDERFEFDMRIEGARYTLEMLKKLELQLNDLTPEQASTYSIDPAYLVPMRMQPVAFIYGEHANQILNLLKTKPVTTIPVVIKRLTQKIDIWVTVAKPDDSKAWDEIVEKNFGKSLDHRSFYFKQNEKRLTNTKSFKSEAQARYVKRLENKPEEFKLDEESDFSWMGGSPGKYFFSSFTGLSSGIVQRVPPDFQDELLEQGKHTPSQHLPYQNAPLFEQWPQFRLLFAVDSLLEDALRILLFSIEKNHSNDKDRMHKWLVSFFSDFLDKPLPRDMRSNKSSRFFEHIPQEDESLEVKEELDAEKRRKLAVGRPKQETTNTMGSEPAPGRVMSKFMQKWLESESYSDPELVVSDSVTDSTQDLLVLRKDADFRRYLPVLLDNQVYYVTNTVYVFLRFLYSIYERLLKVKLTLNAEEQSHCPLERGEYVFSETVEGLYLSFLDRATKVLKGTYDASKYEDSCRTLLGTDAYMLFTFDKLITSAAKALLAIVNDDLAKKAGSLFRKFRKERINEEMYLAEVFNLAASAQGEIYRLWWSKKWTVLAITYIEGPYEKLNSAKVESAQRYFQDYVSGAPQATDLEKEIAPMLRHLDRHFAWTKMTEGSFSSRLSLHSGIEVGLVEQSCKLVFVPRTEDFQVNSSFQNKGALCWVKSEDKTYLFRDKSSFIQKATELAERKLMARLTAN